MTPSRYAEAVPPKFRKIRIPAAGTRIAVWERPGLEPSLIWVHGNSASKGSFRAVLQEPALATRRLVALDLPGCGESGDATDYQYTIPAFARLLRQVVHALDLGHPVVMGWSLGGHAAIEMIGQDPDLARALILTGTPPCGPGAEQLMQIFHASDLMQVTMGEFPSPPLLDRYVRALYGDSQPLPAELFAAARRCDGRMRRVFSEHWLRGDDGYDQRRVVADWPRPIALIQGDAEPFFDPLGLQQLAWKNLWRGASQTIAGTGHAPFFERPAEYANLVAQFLQELAA